MILGIDEAGRGPVLGPLVVAAVALRPQPAAALTRRGVCDSKAFGAGPDAVARRAERAAHVARLADAVGIEVIGNAEVDHFAGHGRLILHPGAVRADRAGARGARRSPQRQWALRGERISS